MRVRGLAWLARWATVSIGAISVACQAFLSIDGPPGPATDGGESLADGGDAAAASDTVSPAPDANDGGSADRAFSADAFIATYTFEGKSPPGPAFVEVPDGGPTNGPYLLGAFDDPPGADPTSFPATFASRSGPFHHVAVLADLEVGLQASPDDAGSPALATLVSLGDTNNPSHLSMLFQSVNDAKQAPVIRFVVAFPPVAASVCALEVPLSGGWMRVGADVQFLADSTVSVDLQVAKTLRHCEFSTATPPAGLDFGFGLLQMVNGAGKWSAGWSLVQFAME